MAIVQFDVDFGIAFKESDIKKQIKGQEDKIIKMLENGEPIETKLTVKNAIDDKGNPIDEASLKRFTAKYEKQVNSVLKNLTNSFSDKAMKTMSSEITKELSSTLNELFEEISLSIQAGIIKMQNDIMTALGNNSVKVDMSNMVDINDKNISKDIEQSTENIKKELKNAKKELISEYELLLEEKDKAERKLEAERKKDNSKKDNIQEVKVGRLTFNSDSINKIKQDEKKFKSALNSVAKEFKKVTDQIEASEDDGEVDRLTERQEKLSHVLLKLTQDNRELLSNLFPKDVDIDYVDEVEQFFDSLEQNVRWESESYIKILEEEAKEIENKIKDFEKRTGLTASSIKKTKQVEVKTKADTDNELDETVFEQYNTPTGREKNISKFNVEANINNKTLIKKISKAIDIIKGEIKKKPIEVPIKVEQESIGGFIEDIGNALINNPFDIALNEENIADQIKKAAKSVNVELGSATVSSVNANDVRVSSDSLPSSLSSSNPITSSIFGISDDSLFAAFEGAEEEASGIENAMSDVNEEVEELDNSIDNANTSLDKTTEKVEVVKKTVKEIADILTNEVEIIDNQAIKELDNKIKVYDEVLDDLRRKKDASPSSKPLDGGIKENELLKKKDKTEEDKERLKLLKQEREQRNAIRKEWGALEKILKNVNDAQNRLDNSDYSKQLKELSTLRSTKHLSQKQQERRAELESQEKKLLEQKETDERLIKDELKRLEIAKQTSSYFGQMANSTLVDLHKEVYGNFTKKILKEKAATAIARANKSYLSESYTTDYEKSKKGITQGKDKKLSPLMQEKRNLENTFNLWQNVNSLIEDKGKEKALGSVNYELQQINKEINRTKSELASAKQALKNGVYTPAKYAEVEQQIENEQRILYDKRKALNDSANILKHKTEEEIKIKASQHKANLDLFNKDIASEEGRNKRIDQLRYKDLKSYASYKEQYEKQQQRKANRNSYESQLDSIMPKINKNGKTEKQIEKEKYNAKNKALDKLGIRKEYWDNEKAIERYENQLKNVELDLNEILRLTNDINNLSDEIEQGNLSSDVVYSKKQEMSGKRLALETLIARTGFDAGDILSYQHKQNGKSTHSSDVSSTKRKAELKDFNKDTKSVQEIVDNISVELNKAVKENNELSDSIEASKRKLKSIKDEITAKHQDDAKNILDKINELRETRRLLKEEIKNSTDEDEKDSKKQKVGSIDHKLKGLEYYYHQASNSALLQATIDSEFNSRKDVEDIEKQVNAKENLKRKNEEYIKSLKELKEEQEEIRKQQEPTSQELSVDKRKENTRYKKEVAKIDTTISKLDEDASKAQSKLDVVSKSTREELEKINAELEKEIANLKEIQNVEKTPIKTIEHSSIYQEYLEQQKPIQEKISQYAKQISENDKQRAERQKKLNDLMQSYGVETEEQLKAELIRRKNFQEIVSLQEKIERASRFANAGDKVAIADINNFNAMIDSISGNYGFNQEDLLSFNKINNDIEALQKRIDNHNRNSQIVSLERNLTERLNNGEKDTDEVKNLKKALDNLIKDDKDEQDIIKLKTKLQKLESEISVIVSKIGVENAKYYKRALKGSELIPDISDISKDQIDSFEKGNNALFSLIRENQNILDENQSNYILKLSQALTEETKQYNAELSESGELTEKAENHLLNMTRYMDEMDSISGRELQFSEFGIDVKTFEKMIQISKENKEIESNISRSEANYEAKQQQKIKAQEKVVAALQSQKQKQEEQLRLAQKDFEQKQKALDVEKQKKEELEEQHKLEVAAIDERRKAMKERQANASQTPISSIDTAAVDVSELDKTDEILNEINVEAEKTTEVIQEEIQKNDTVQEQLIEKIKLIAQAVKLRKSENKLTEEQIALIDKGESALLDILRNSTYGSKSRSAIWMSDFSEDMKNKNMSQITDELLNKYHYGNVINPYSKDYDEFTQRVYNSNAIQVLGGISSRSQRRDRDSINQINQLLNEYAKTAEISILEEVKRFISGKGKNLSNTIKPYVLSFVDDELNFRKNNSQSLFENDFETQTIKYNKELESAIKRAEELSSEIEHLKQSNEIPTWAKSNEEAIINRTKHLNESLEKIKVLEDKLSKLNSTVANDKIDTNKTDEVFKEVQIEVEKTTDIIQTEIQKQENEIDSFLNKLSQYGEKRFKTFRDLMSGSRSGNNGSYIGKSTFDFELGDEYNAKELIDSKYISLNKSGKSYAILVDEKYQELADILGDLIFKYKDVVANKDNVDKDPIDVFKNMVPVLSGDENNILNKKDEIKSLIQTINDARDASFDMWDDLQQEGYNSNYDNADDWISKEQHKKSIDLAKQEAEAWQRLSEIFKTFEPGIPIFAEDGRIEEIPDRLNNIINYVAVYEDSVEQLQRVINEGISIDDFMHEVDHNRDFKNIQHSIDYIKSFTASDSLEKLYEPFSSSSFSSEFSIASKMSELRYKLSSVKKYVESYPEDINIMDSIKDNIPFLEKTIERYQELLSIVRPIEEENPLGFSDEQQEVYQILQQEGHSLEDILILWKQINREVEKSVVLNENNQTISATGFGDENSVGFEMAHNVPDNPKLLHSHLDGMGTFSNEDLLLLLNNWESGIRELLLFVDGSLESLDFSKIGKEKAEDFQRSFYDTYSSLYRDAINQGLDPDKNDILSANKKKALEVAIKLVPDVQYSVYEDFLKDYETDVAEDFGNMHGYITQQLKKIDAQRLDVTDISDTNIDDNGVIDFLQKIQDEFEETQQEAKETAEVVVTAFRGIIKNLTDTHLNSYWTDNLGEARYFANQSEFEKPAGKDYETGGVLKSKLSFKNPYITDVRGRTNGEVRYLGDGLDEVSKKAIILDEQFEQTANNIKESLKSLGLENTNLDVLRGDVVPEAGSACFSFWDDNENYQIARNAADAIKLIASNCKLSSDELQLLSEQLKIAFDLGGQLHSIFKDESNPYIQGPTDLVRALVEETGKYDGIIFKNIFDGSEVGANHYVPIFEDQISDIENLGVITKEQADAYDKLGLKVEEVHKILCSNIDNTNIISETDSLIKKQEQLEESAKDVDVALDEQMHTEPVALPPSPIVKQQQEAREEIDETNNKLQEQIGLAVKNAQVSIAEGSYVNISGDVKIDKAQWSGIEKITGSAEELLNVVKNIYLAISTGTPKVASQLNAIQTPIENVSAQIQQVDGVVSKADVKLKSFGNSIKAVTTGDMDLKSKEFKDVQKAIDAMNVALKENKNLSKIASSGDLTAKYHQKFDEDGELVGSYVDFNAVFKDAEGKVIKTTYVYDVLDGTLHEVDKVVKSVSDKFTQQEKVLKTADRQLAYYTSQLDKLLIKYDTFDINDFGLDDDDNLFANVGTRAEQIYDVVSGNTKRAIKDVITYKKEVETAFASLKYKAENGLYTEKTFKEATDNFNKMVANFESKMNTVNRNMNTATEKNARSLLGKWQNELDAQISWLNNDDGTVRKDTSVLNARGLEYVEKYKVELTKLKSLYASFVEQGEYFTESQILSWKSQMQTISDIKKAIDSNASQKYVNGKGYSIDNLSIDSSVFDEMSKNSTYARQVLSGLAQEINGVEVEVIELSKDNKTLTYSFQDVNKNTQICKLSVDDFGKTVRNTITKSSQHVGLFSKIFGTLKDKLIQITKYVSAYEIFYKVVNAVRSGIEIIKELDSAMTEMKKVTKESQQALNEFASTSHKVAQEIGSTASTIQNSAADWMRLGYSIKEAAGLAKNTSILMNVSEFEDIDSATESMVAMIQAFKGEGTDVVELSSTLIDKLNNIGNNYSISTSELAESLKRSSGTLIAANNSVDEAIALSVAANALIQDAESTGSALKVISMRIRGTSVSELEEIGEDTEGLIDTTSKLQEKVQSLTAINGKMGVSLLDVNGNYRTTYEILQDIADIWKEIGEADIADGQNRQAALLEVLAGKTRAQSLASLLQNGDMLRSVYEDVQQSEGSALRENEAYMESIDAHLQVLESKWQELWDNTLAKEQINWVIDRLSNILDIVNEIGLLNTALIAGGGIFGAYTAFKGEGRVKMFTLSKYAFEEFNGDVYELRLA